MTDDFFYLKSNVEGMSEDERILFIYTELLKILGRAQMHMRRGEIEPRVTAINKAIDIIFTLNSILSLEGGIISAQFRALYIYAINQLSTANSRKSEKHLDEVIKIFRELQETWSEKIRKDKNELTNHEQTVSANEQRASVQRQLDGVELYG